MQPFYLLYDLNEYVDVQKTDMTHTIKIKNKKNQDITSSNYVGKDVLI